MEYAATAFVQGDAYFQMAWHTIARATQVLGHDTLQRTIPHGEDLWDAKLSILEEAQCPVLCFDVDMVFCSWDWNDFKPDMFNAVADYPLPTWKHGAKVLENYYPVATAINAGLWFAPPTPDILAVFKRARELLVELKDFKYKFGDQTALNMAIHELKLPVNFLPHSYNYQVAPSSPRNPKPPVLPPGTRVGHAIGQSFLIDGNPPVLSQKLSRVLKMLELNPPDVDSLFGRKKEP